MTTQYLRAVGQSILQLLIRHAFCGQGHNDLQTSKSNSSSYCHDQPPHKIWWLYAKAFSSYWLDNFSLVKVTLTLTFDLEINRGHLPAMTNLPTKSKDCEPKHFLVIDWVIVTLTLNLLTPKTLGIFHSIRASILWSLKNVGQMIFHLLSGHGFQVQGDSDLYFSPTDPKNNRDLLFRKWNHPTNFEGCESNGTRVTERRWFSNSRWQ